MKTFDDFIDLVHSIEGRAMLEDFLMGITTEKEREELTKRVEIVERLLAGQAQQEIAHDLKVGVATVTRGSKEVAKGRFRVLK